MASRSARPIVLRAVSLPYPNSDICLRNSATAGERCRAARSPPPTRSSAMRSSDLNWSRFARLRSASQSCWSTRPGLPLYGIAVDSAEWCHGAARKHARQPFGRGAIHHDHRLRVHVIWIARRDTHQRLIHRLPVTRPLHLSGIEAQRVEEGEMRRWRIAGRRGLRRGGCAGSG